ncbi:threonine-phosphate decarboxylase CobD [Methyloprofundus sp.]|uniref:threonine-phosphate decarboxylase CobD n=1 Tax=Methyloprofundus sp. TaxID=2020875 RepID=UPI003D09FAD2
MLKHGGRLLEAAQQYQIPLPEWLDLSTGINPNGYPIPAIPDAVWQRLPEEQDELIASAQEYYQCQSILAVAGSQAAIQSLPLLRSPATVGIVTPSYAEHAYAWTKAGHTILPIASNEIDQYINQLDTLILVNPNNPTACTFTQQQCQAWLENLNQRQGWLIIDEAFIDCTPELSLSKLAPLKGLIILRSVGKFFGLAGLRAGFVLAEATVLNSLNELLGPWALSNPSRFVCARALQDKVWQTQTRQHTQQKSQRLNALLSKYQLEPTGSTQLFQWVQTEQAEQRHQQLANLAVFTRLFKRPNSLRFGLPGNEPEWQHLESALQQIVIAEL